MMASTREFSDRGQTRRSAAHRHRIPQGDPADKPTISATRRWLLISRNVYDRAQQRGFVGGDPLEDLSEATRQIDDEYDTDIKGLLSLTDPTELVEQFRNLFAGYGLGKRSLDQLLEKNRTALENLAAFNRTQRKGAPDSSHRRASLLRSAADEAKQNLEALAEGAMRFEQRAHLPGQPTQAFVSLLSRLSSLAESAGEFAGNGELQEDKPPRSSGPVIRGAVIQSYEGMRPAQLAEAPVEALKGLSPANGARLDQAFGIVTIRDMAGSRLVEQAAGIVTLADAEEEDGSLGELADGPVRGLEGITVRQARVLDEALRISTIRDLADNRFFRLARAIVALADLETQSAR